MENLSKIEKRIVEYLVKSDNYSDDSIADISEIEFSQSSSSNIETLIYILMEQDDLLRRVGLKISFDKKENRLRLFLMEELDKKENESDIIFKGNWIIFTKVNYLIVRVTNFLKQLELNGYVDSLQIRNSLSKGKKFLPFEIHCKENFKETLEFSETETLANFLECFKNNYVPNNNLRSFYNNDYKSLALTIAEKDTQLAIKNNRIAKYALYTAVFSAIAGLIATFITLYSIGIPASIKIDDNQIDSIIEKISIKENNSTNTDTLKLEQ